MNSTRLRQLIKKHCKVDFIGFHGVFGRDNIPLYVTDYPYCFIANTDISKSRGKHWVVFYFESENHVEFFDSLGNHPSFYKFNLGDNFCIDYNFHIQSSHSSVCGYYCVYYLLKKSQGKSFSSIIHSFSSTNFDWNDYQIIQLFHSH